MARIASGGSGTAVRSVLSNTEIGALTFGSARIDRDCLGLRTPRQAAAKASQLIWGCAQTTTSYRVAKARPRSGKRSGIGCPGCHV